MTPSLLTTDGLYRGFRYPSGAKLIIYRRLPVQIHWHNCIYPFFQILVNCGFALFTNAIFFGASPNQIHCMLIVNLHVKARLLHFLWQEMVHESRWPRSSLTFIVAEDTTLCGKDLIS